MHFAGELELLLLFSTLFHKLDTISLYTRPINKRRSDMAKKGQTIEVFERYEMKYMLDDAQYEQVLSALLTYMNVDSYSAKTGFYPICNIYYDTPTDALIRTSLEKPVYKEKLRLRSYGNPKDMDTPVFLEIKKKYDHLVTKRRIVLKLSDAYRYMDDGTAPEDYWVNSQILREMDYFRSVYDLSPKLYLSYQRKALAGKEDPEFRVTFDTDIRVRRDNVGLEQGNEGRQLLPPGKWLMEIKVLDAMPLWCTRILSGAGVYSTSFSKYGTEYQQYVQRRQQIEQEVAVTSV
jgi:hypothetical protein